MIQCNKSCSNCKELNTKTDNKGYPYEYECLKYQDSVFKKEFNSTKEFSDNLTKNTSPVDHSKYN